MSPYSAVESRWTSWYAASNALPKYCATLFPNPPCLPITVILRVKGLTQGMKRLINGESKTKSAALGRRLTNLKWVPFAAHSPVELLPLDEACNGPFANIDLEIPGHEEHSHKVEAQSIKFRECLVHIKRGIECLHMFEE